MTNASVTITADEFSLSDQPEWSGFADELDHVHVGFAREDMGDPTCKHCGEPIFEETGTDGADLWLHWNNDLHCDADDGPVAEPDTSPGSWCNSANIHVDDEENSVTVTISVGDLRGAFAFTVRRHPDGYLLLHTPHPGEGMAHMPLTELHAGTHRIGV